MKWYRVFGLFVLFFSGWAYAHHYKGLPHYGYFENYPQVPFLEFIKETPTHEVFLTVYNFQGLNLDQVDSPDDVRMYLYIYDLEADTVYKGQASFSVYSHDELIHRTGVIEAEQENIFVLTRKIKSQDDLRLKIDFFDSQNRPTSISMDFQITETLLQKYGLVGAIGLFFMLVILLKYFARNFVANEAKSTPLQEV